MPTSASNKSETPRKLLLMRRLTEIVEKVSSLRF